MGVAPNFVDGTVPPAADLNFGLNPPRSHYGQQAQSTVTSTSAPLSWGTPAVYDTDSMWSSGAPTRIQPNTPGLYQCQGCVTLNAASSGERFVTLLMNAGGNPANGIGVGLAREAHPSASDSTVIRWSVDLRFNGTTDYLEVFASSGASVTTTPGTASTYVQARWVATY